MGPFYFPLTRPSPFRPPESLGFPSTGFRGPRRKAKLTENKSSSPFSCRQDANADPTPLLSLSPPPPNFPIFTPKIADGTSTLRRSRPHPLSGRYMLFAACLLCHGALPPPFISLAVFTSSLLTNSLPPPPPRLPPQLSRTAVSIFSC